MRISLYRGRLHRVCGGPKRWDIPRSSIPLGVFRRALEQRKAAIEALELSSDHSVPLDEELIHPAAEINLKQQDAEITEGVVKEEHRQDSLLEEEKSKGREDDAMDDVTQFLEEKQEPEQNGQEILSRMDDRRTGKGSPVTAERKRKREEHLSERAERTGWKQAEDAEHEKMEVEGLQEFKGSENEVLRSMDIDGIAHSNASEKDAKDISASAIDFKDVILAGKQETSCSLAVAPEITMDFENGHCKTAAQEQGEMEEAEKEKLHERKRQKRAELETKLKHLTSEKHRLVQMLKQVLNEEESKKQGHAILQSPTSIGSHGNVEGTIGMCPAEPEISVTRADLEEGELDFARSPSPQVHASVIGTHSGQTRTSALPSGSILGRSSDSPQYLSQGAMPFGCSRGLTTPSIPSSAPGGSSMSTVSAGMSHVSYLTPGGHSYSSNVV
ncbi:hypothetical protein O6H91_19G045500 [Diphasiastrum complanatum]|nr:hypothetical protein O6H91_19G045500 [Diphasiastrum complanatum]